MSSLPFSNLEILSAELLKLADAGNWEAAAELAQKITPDRLPAARSSDRSAIEAAQQNIAAVMERAGPLRDDIARLLAAYGPPPDNT